eukprot:scaffold13820_cov207-Alexandrium_tamarense.AAC.2
MPRVHGIDIIPRRGRGRRRSGPLPVATSAAATNDDGGGADFAENAEAIGANTSTTGDNSTSCDVDDINCVEDQEAELSAAPLAIAASEQRQDDASSSVKPADNDDAESLHHDEDLLDTEEQATAEFENDLDRHHDNGGGECGEMSELHLRDDTAAATNQSTGDDTSNDSISVARQQHQHGPSEQQQVPPQTTQRKQASELIQAAAATTTMPTLTIKPQPKEILDNLQFNTYSFSVPTYSHKSPDTSSYTHPLKSGVNGVGVDVGEELGWGGLLAGGGTDFIGIGPSLEIGDHRLVETTTAAAKATTEAMNGADVAVDEVEATTDALREAEASVGNDDGLSFQPTEAAEDVATTDINTNLSLADDGEDEIAASASQETTLIANKSAASAVRAPSTRLNPNAQWLYNRCSQAKLQMGTSLTALELSLRTLNALLETIPNEKRDNSNDYDDDDDDASTINTEDPTHDDDDETQSLLQSALFEITKDGKKRDLQFVFDVCEKTKVLRGDGGLRGCRGGEMLREVALAVDGVDVGVTGECGVLAEFVNQDATKASSNNLSEAHSTPHKSPMTHGTDSTANLTPELSPPVDVHTANGVPLVQTAGNSGGGYAMMCDLEEDVKQPAASDDGKQPLTQGSWKKPRSRRKKRPTSHCGALGNDSMRNDDDTSSKQSAGGSQANADFPAKNDGLDIEEDGASWNFLSTAEDQHIDRVEDADDTAFPQRVTRSMQQPLEPMEVDDDKESDVDEKDRGNDQEDAIDDDYVDQRSVERDMEENDNGEPMEEEVEEKEPHGSDEDEKETPEDNEKMEDTQDLRDTPSISFDAFVASAGSYSRSRKRRSEKQSKVRVMFTGVNVTSKHKQVRCVIFKCTPLDCSLYTQTHPSIDSSQMIEDIGAELVEAIGDAATATHIIVNDGKSYKLRRTPKLMIGISKTNNIISLEWLEQSARNQRVLETEEFLYFGDEEAEERYNFSMKETIQNGITARRERGGVLGGWNVYICNGVAGNNAPSAKELHLIIESAGGRVIKSLSDSYSLNPLKTIIMTSDPSTISQRGEAGVARMTSMGTTTCVPQWLFQVIISQKLPNDDGEEFVASNRGPESSTPGKEDEGSHVSRMVRCNSHELLVSEMSASPLKQRKKRMRSTFDADEILVR